MNTAEYIIKRLEELGVNDFFGLPGDYNFNILYAIDNNRNTNWIGCTSELNAGYAADGYARNRGFGAVVTTYGVGELSVINAIAGSMAENVPVVCLVGLPSTNDIDNKTLLHHNLQEVNYQNFINAYSNVTAASAFLTRDNAKLEIDRVLKTLVKEKKPVYIALPEDIAQTEISDRVVSYEWRSDKATLEEAAAKIADKIQNAQKPVIIGDVLVKRFDALIEYREFVAKSGIPVSNFLMGANLIDMDAENYIGGYFGGFRNPIAGKYVEETDCLITVGAIYSDINSLGQSLTQKINDNIAIYGNYTYIEGKKYDNIKMSELLEQITGLIDTKDIEIDRPNIGYKNKDSINEQLTSEYIYPRIQNFLKDNDILVAETGIIPLGVSQMKFPPNADIQMQLLWGSIGWATPAAFGASIAKPQSRVILLTGEGAHLITAAEIGSMLRFGTKPIVIVLNNDGYTTERLLSDDSNNKFNDIIKINFAKLARVFEGDIWATKVTSAEDFDKALKVTQIMNKLCYIEVSIDNLDVPSLAKDFADSIRKSTKKIVIPASNIKAELSVSEPSDITNKSGDMQYETVVHKVFNEETEEKQNG